jgi:hypothetical protein
VVGVALLVPSVLLLALRYGGIGAAANWAVLNAGYVLIQTRVMHRRLLPGHLRKWYLTDVGLPVLASSCAAGTLRLALPTAALEQHRVVCVAAAYVAAAAATVFVLPVSRAWAQRRMSGVWTSLAGAA